MSKCFATRRKQAIGLTGSATRLAPCAPAKLSDSNGKISTSNAIAFTSDSQPGKDRPNQQKQRAVRHPLPFLQCSQPSWSRTARNGNQIPRTFSSSPRNGRPPSSNKVVGYQLWPILDALGIPRCGLHAFRHSVASFIVDAGYPIEVAQQQLSAFKRAHDTRLYSSAWRGHGKGYGGGCSISEIGRSWTRG
jgi:hypothetical protein